VDVVAPPVTIERLALRVAGLDEQAAQALARRVAEGLAPGLRRPEGMAGRDHLEIEVTAASGDPDLLARCIVEAIDRTLARDRISGAPRGEVGR
jgi:hypothetical protein